MPRLPELEWDDNTTQPARPRALRPVFTLRGVRQEIRKLTKRINRLKADHPEWEYDSDDYALAMRSSRVRARDAGASPAYRPARVRAVGAASGPPRGTQYAIPYR